MEFYLTSLDLQADVIKKASPRFIYFQINSVASFLNTCTCITNPLNHQRGPNEMQTILGFASVLTTHPYPLTESHTLLKFHKTHPTSVKTESEIVLILGPADPMEEVNTR